MPARRIIIDIGRRITYITRVRIIIRMNRPVRIIHVIGNIKIRFRIPEIIGVIIKINRSGAGDIVMMINDYRLIRFVVLIFRFINLLFLIYLLMTDNSELRITSGE